MTGTYDAPRVRRTIRCRMIASTLGNASCAAGGDRLPVLGARPATEVVERHRAGPAGLSHDDPADHSRRLVGLTEVVVDARDGEGHVVAVARVHEEPRIPGRRAFGDAQRVAVVLRMVRDAGADVEQAPTPPPPACCAFVLGR